MYFSRFYTLDEMLAGVEAVTADEVQKIAQEFFESKNITLAMLGNLGRLPDSARGLELLALKRLLTRAARFRAATVTERRPEGLCQHPAKGPKPPAQPQPKGAVCGILLACLLLLTFAASAHAQDLDKIEPQGYVSDFAGVLGPRAQARASAYCARLREATGVQVAIVTIHSLKDEPIEDASNKLFHRWGVGEKGKDEGLLLLLSIDDHKDRLEIGYGLEPIPDRLGCDGDVLRSIRPYLRQGQYDEAVLTAVQQINARIAAAKGVKLDSTPEIRPVRLQPRTTHIPWTLIIIGLWLLFSLIRRGRGGGGFLLGMLLGNIFGRGGGWGGGGGFGGYDSRGGGGGGFGGFGGGDSGGGGASGDW